MSERNEWPNFLLPVALIGGLILLLSLDLGPVAEKHMMDSGMTVWLERIVGLVAFIAEISAAAVIGFAVCKALVGYFMRRGAAVRRDLGHSLALGLEFTIASDILQTAMAPTQQEIAALTSIVLLRTLLNYFLEREIKDPA